MKKAVVVGGAGFIGSNVVDLLLEEGYEVVIYDNLETGKIEFINPDAQLSIVDIRDNTALRVAASADFPNADVVFHLAALPRVEPSIKNPIRFHETNVDGTLNIFWACKEFGVKKVVYSSSSSVYGDAKELPITEKTAVQPMSPYALQKLCGDQYAELFCSLYEMNIACLRYFNVYGKREPSVGAYVPVVGIWFRQFMAKEPLTITGDGGQSRDFVNVSDVAKANLICAEANLEGYQVFNVGSGKQYELNSIAALISKEIAYVPARIEPRHTLADVSELRKLGWKPAVSLEEYVVQKRKEIENHRLKNK